MALIDRIKWDGMLNNAEWLVYRYPGEAFVTGSQLIVGEGQVAVFVKGGQALDYFTAGTYTLSTANIPLLAKFINMPFGGKTPFTAEIYFINKTSKLDITWGTIDPIQLIDPKYHIKLRVRAFGQIGMKVADYRVLLTELIGAMRQRDVVNYGKMLNYFKGILIMKVKTLIAQAIIKNKVSALEISASLETISDYCQEEIGEEFDRFGLKVVNFFIQSINFPDEDFDEINRILGEKASFDIIGDQRYVTKRSFDTMDLAAANEGGTAGAFTGAGMGLGLGVSMGGAMGGLTSNITTAAPAGNQKTCPECNAVNPASAVFCAACGARVTQEGVKCPDCEYENQAGSKFCISCGAALTQTQTNKCEKCGEENEPNAKFCRNCGTKLEG